MKKSLTVICPVYNEEAVIRDFYNELKEVLVRLKDKYESKTLFVVDPSTDSTLEILKQIAQTDRSVQIIALSSQFGHQMALLAGMDNSHSDCTIMMDSDLQHPPSLIPEMLNHFEKGFDVVYTVRRDVPESNIFKRLSSKAFYRMINQISQVPINESAADFRLISRRVLTVFKNQIRERNQFLRGLIKWVGFKSTGIPFQAKKRPAGKSKYSFGRMVQFGLHGILSFSKRPLQAATFVGFIFASLGFIYGLIVFIQYFFDRSLPSGWATLIILISMFSGVQLIFLGIIGEYIGAIFDEVKGRPHYIIDEKINFNKKILKK